MVMIGVGDEYQLLFAEVSAVPGAPHLVAVSVILTSPPLEHFPYRAERGEN